MILSREMLPLSKRNFCPKLVFKFVSFSTGFSGKSLLRLQLMLIESRFKNVSPFRLSEFSKDYEDCVICTATHPIVEALKILSKQKKLDEIFSNKKVSQQLQLQPLQLQNLVEIAKQMLDSNDFWSIRTNKNFDAIFSVLNFCYRLDEIEQLIKDRSGATETIHNSYCYSYFKKRIVEQGFKFQNCTIEDLLRIRIKTTGIIQKHVILPSAEIEIIDST